MPDPAIVPISTITPALDAATIASADKLVVLDVSKLPGTPAEATAVITYGDLAAAIVALVPGGGGGGNIITGTAVPTTEGVDGDFYIRQPMMDIYGPKTAGAWGAVSGTLKGQDGLGDRQVVASVAGVLTIDYAAGKWVDVALVENITSIVVNNWPASGTLGRLTIRYTLGVGGPFTVAHGTVAATTYKEDGALPTITATEGNKTTVQIISSDALATADVIVGASNLAIA